MGKVISLDKKRVNQLPAILKKQSSVIVGNSPTSKDLLRESAREFQRYIMPSSNPVDSRSLDSDGH